MAGRLTVFAVFAVLGFVGGILAEWAYDTLYPIIQQLFPYLFQAKWLLSGLAGTLLTLVIVIIWASFSPDK